MTKTKSTKRALLMSALSLLMCISMLIGSTSAWFTDSVTSANNIIQSGTLDVVLEYKTNWSDEWAPVDDNTKIFKDGALYEPGYTEVVYLRVSNAGSLALKYMLSLNIDNDKKSINVYGDEFRITDYLYVGTYVQDEYHDGFNYANILMPSLFGTRESALSNVTLATLKEAKSVICKNRPILPGEDTAQVVAIVLTMPETVGNEANTKPGEKAPTVDIGINLLATQYTHENDSFDDQYDADAFLGQVHDIHNLDTLQKAFEDGGKGRIINMYIEGVSEELAKDNSLILNMNTSTLVKEQDAPYAIVNYGDLTIKGEGTIRSEMHGSIENHGNLTVESLNIFVTGVKYGFHVKKGEVTINDLTLHAERGGINVQGGLCTINSAKVTTTNYKTNSGYFVYAASYDENNKAEVVINDGDFRYEGTYYKHRVLCSQGNALITVNGGTFGKGGSKASSDWLIVKDGGKIVINGGTFEFDPTRYLSEDITLGEGCKVEIDENGWWTVTKE
jgi:predicted ribosomally synthesized peptide with SipW-like signal peptide